MHVHAVLRVPDGDQVMVTHGDVIGRVWSAALQLDDPRISEAHAMVSLRGACLWLLALRGRFAVKGRPVDKVELRAGMSVELARGLSIEVAELSLPTEVLALRAPGMTQQTLFGTASLRTRPGPELVPGRQSDAEAVLWHLGGRWRVQDTVRDAGGRDALPLEAGTRFVVGGTEFEVVSIPTQHAGAATHPDPGVSSPLTLITRWDTVHIHRDDRAPLVLGGIAARILSELAAMEVPVDWHLLASQIWPSIHDRPSQRKRLDIALARLRRKLRNAGIRADLVRSSGSGLTELFLMPADRVERQD